MLATRMRDTAFKRVLKAASLGTEVRIDGPFGSFTASGCVPRGGLRGGRHRHHAVPQLDSRCRAKQALPCLVLFYSNRRPEDAAFLSELQEIEKRSPSFQCIGIFTELLRETWRASVESADFERFWRRSIHDGFIQGSAFEPRPVALQPRAERHKRWRMRASVG
ncbi:MAG: hypothetical protein ACRD3V_19925 [Vicinamibacteria bacterium]